MVQGVQGESNRGSQSADEERDGAKQAEKGADGPWNAVRAVNTIFRLKVYRMGNTALNRD